MYQRVIPRDFFNEAKLFKSMGRLTLLIHEKIQGAHQLEVREPENRQEGFQVLQDADSADLMVYNYQVIRKHDKRPLMFYSKYNCKDNFTLYTTCPDHGDMVEVFDDEGDFTEDFQKLFLPTICILFRDDIGKENWEYDNQDHYIKLPEGNPVTGWYKIIDPFYLQSEYVEDFIHSEQK